MPFLLIAVWVLAAVVLRAECRTVLDIPCHTIEYRGEQTTYFHRGFTDLSTISIQSIQAVGADGSTYSEEVYRDGYGFTGRVNSTRSIWIYSAPSNRIFVVSRKSARTRCVCQACGMTVHTAGPKSVTQRVRQGSCIAGPIFDSPHSRPFSDYAQYAGIAISGTGATRMFGLHQISTVPDFGVRK